MFSTSHLHPMLVHFPIALIAFGFLFECIALIKKSEIYFHKMSLNLLLAGTLSGIFTWSSGYIFTSAMSGTAGQVKETHELFATITVALLLVTTSLRLFQIRFVNNKILMNMSFITYALAAIGIAVTGYYGGTLVYNYMMPL